MNSKQKQQSIADKTLRESPTLDSAPPGVARTHEDYCRRFSANDYEKTGKKYDSLRHQVL